MSVQIGGGVFSNIGRMFGRLNAPEVYGNGKSREIEPESATAGGIDQVNLSSLAPKPLSARLLEEAVAAGRELNRGRVSPGNGERLREDRVFAAVSTLAALGFDEIKGSELSWPGGIPVPTREELEAARRRLAQRLDSPEQAENREAAGRIREELWRKVAGLDLSETAGMSTSPTAILGGRS
ncbi:MAG: hypothetical protein LBU64_10600 [Planctomycetota bacterium]|jgi:hypothetical protein|nr:hypothetical protein [Planctomycetota bacterium]